MEKVLIFGVNGFVGSHLVKEYFDQGYEIIGAGTDLATEIKDIKYRHCNVTNAQDVEILIKEQRPKHIINLAAQGSVGLSWEKPQETMLINTIGTVNILEAVQKYSKSARMLFIGTSEIYHSKNESINENDLLLPRNPYAVSKLAQEHMTLSYMERYGLNVICTRSFNHTGIGQNINSVIPSFCKQVADIERSKHSETMHVGNINVSRDISDVRDVVKAYRMLLENTETRGIYNIGSGTSIKIKDILDYLLKMSTKHIVIEVDKQLYRAEDLPYICCDNSRLKKATGWEPQYTITDTVDSMYKYYLNAEE